MLRRRSSSCVPDARICSYECTFCAACTKAALPDDVRIAAANTCSGGRSGQPGRSSAIRPRRPASSIRRCSAWRVDATRSENRLRPPAPPSACPTISHTCSTARSSRPCGSAGPCIGGCPPATSRRRRASSRLPRAGCTWARPVRRMAAAGAAGSRRTVGPALHARHGMGVLGRCRGHRGGPGVRGVGAATHRPQLERDGHAESRPRTRHQRPLRARPATRSTAAWLLGFAGSAIALGHRRGSLALAIVYLSLLRKYRLEERWMREYFGTAYDDYRRRVKALVPFLF